MEQWQCGQLLAGAKLALTKRSALSLAYGKMKTSDGNFNADATMFLVDISMELLKQK